MNYCIYFKSTGELQSVTSTLHDSDELAYIVLTSDEAEMFCSGRKSLMDFKVVTDFPGSTSGKLISRQELDKSWATVDDVVFRIPVNCAPADFTITQDTTNKCCTARLTNPHNIINIKYIVVAACLQGDPHLPVWVWSIKFSDLLDTDVKIDYQGTDDLTFYTKRFFNTYSHEHI